ncbi:hypothetical protein J6590_071316 [Homalodisca vitripennis]|nr:hypothetical protein J6590_071316 [Homalodisca vitripennis]
MSQFIHNKSPLSPCHMWWMYHTGGGPAAQAQDTCHPLTCRKRTVASPTSCGCQACAHPYLALTSVSFLRLVTWLHLTVPVPPHWSYWNLRGGGSSSTRLLPAVYPVTVTTTRRVIVLNCCRYVCQRHPTCGEDDNDNDDDDDVLTGSPRHAVTARASADDATPTRAQNHASGQDKEMDGLRRES